MGLGRGVAGLEDGVDLDISRDMAALAAPAPGLAWLGVPVRDAAGVGVHECVDL